MSSSRHCFSYVLFVVAQNAILHRLYLVFIVLCCCRVHSIYLLVYLRKVRKVYAVFDVLEDDAHFRESVLELELER
jgi:hypothetical protein